MPTAISYEKAPGEVLDFRFDFRRTESLDDDPLDSGTVTEVNTTDLTIGSATVSGTQVRARISGGTDGDRYLVRVLGTTLGGQIVQGDVALDVRQPDS